METTTLLYIELCTYENLSFFASGKTLLASTVGRDLDASMLLLLDGTTSSCPLQQCSRYFFQNMTAMCNTGNYLCLYSQAIISPVTIIVCGVRKYVIDTFLLVAGTLQGTAVRRQSGFDNR